MRSPEPAEGRRPEPAEGRCPEPVEGRVKAWELYRIRRLELAAERRALEAQLARNQAQALLLEVELKYGLLASDATLDIHTGRIAPCPATPEGPP